ncbi:MAG: S24 family peptidase [Patescibacteria group bacterium]
MHSTQKKLLELLTDNKIGDVTLRQLGILAGINHPQNVKHHLDQLEKRGLVKYNPDSKKIDVVKKLSESSEGLLSLPIYGAADCGFATHFADNYVEGYLKVSKKLLTKTRNIFILEASGDSMNKAKVNGDKNIENGDYVVVDSEYQQPRNGDYIVSIIDGMANIKKYFEDRENEQIVLMPESTKNFPPIFIGIDEMENYSICGKVIQVIKKPKLI